jgi:ABC-2 type transport system ATP-binding protein
VADRVAGLRTRLVASDTPAALRARLFGTRVRIGIDGRAASFVDALRTAGAGDVRVEGDTLSVGLAQGVTIPGLVRHLVGAGADITSVVPEQPPLEEVYLRLLQETPA